jgi:predicted amidohydrolase/GNAT superfamily N-acetyltransferase
VTARLEVDEIASKLELRTLVHADFEAWRDLGLRCFPDMEAWERAYFDSQIEHFPEGQMCIELDGRMVASASSLIVRFDDYHDWHSWRDIADNGYIRNHDPDGDTLYGIEIQVDPDMRGYRLSRRLYDARKELARRLNLKRIVIGGRIPGYAKVADRMTAREYVDQVMAKALFDPVLTVQLANGFALQRLVADYLPSDTESRGYATCLEWRNLDYQPRSSEVSISTQVARLSLVQYQMRRIDTFEDFARQCEFYVDVAGEYESDFVLFPELFTTQLLSTIDEKRPGLAARALAEYTPRYLELMSKLAMQYNVNVIGGSQFVMEDDKIQNVAFLLRRDGSIERQAKLHVTPNERKWWGIEPGDELSVFETDCGKIAILVCYDVEFPELARMAAARGAGILFVPFNTADRLGYLRVRSCAQARAIENQMYVAIAGCAGNLPFVENADIHYSQCGVFTPSDVGFARDAIGAESTPNIEAVLTHEVDLAMTRRNRHTGTVRPFTDRRRDLYSIRVRLADGREEDL